MNNHPIESPHDLVNVNGRYIARWRIEKKLANPATAHIPICSDCKGEWRNGGQSLICKVCGLDCT